MYTVQRTNAFKKSFKRCLKRGLDPQALENCVRILSLTGTLPPQYRPHKLSGNFNNCWECHITPDWLLLWEQNDNELTLLLLNTGTHSDLFG